MNINSIALERLLRKDNRDYIDLRDQVDGQCTFIEFCDDKNIMYFTGDYKPEREEVEACLVEVMPFIPEEKLDKMIELAYVDLVKVDKDNHSGLLRIERDFL